MKTKVIEIKANGESKEEIMKAICEIVGEAIDAEHEKNRDVHDLAIHTWKEHRKAAFETIKIMIKCNESVEDVAAFLFATGFTEGYLAALMEDEEESDEEKEETCE